VAELFWTVTGATSKGEGRQRKKGEEKKARDPPPYANSWIRPS